MANDLTIKQRKWLKLYLELGNAQEAAKRVYDCKDDHSAAQIGYENLRKLDYTEFLEEAGITDELLQKKLLEGLDANRTVSARVVNKKGEQVEADSKTDDFIDVPDHQSRHKYLETALKLKQRLLTKFDITSGGKPIPLLGGASVPSNDSTEEASDSTQKD